jgi:hypothetical protein
LWQMWKYHNSVSVCMCILNIQNVYLYVFWTPCIYLPWQSYTYAFLFFWRKLIVKSTRMNMNKTISQNYRFFTEFFGKCAILKHWNCLFCMTVTSLNPDYCSRLMFYCFRHVIA